MTALFLKYRPQNFADLVGQESTQKTLQNALKNQKPGHAYLFAGSRGTGKTSTARIFAKGLNCTDLQNGDPCLKCTFCTDTKNGSLLDVIEIDAASNRGIGEIRELRDKINFAPNHAKRKVYIIDEVHMLTKEAFNALLKTLEEPPDHAFFCLATTEIHKIPETIISRCQTFLFQRFTLPQLTDRLKKICENETFKYDAPALKIIAQKAEGGMRDAISLIEQIAAESDNDITEKIVRKSLGISDTQILENFYQKLTQNETEEALKVLKEITHKGADLRTFGHDFLGFLRNKMYESLKTPQDLPSIILLIEEIEKALTKLKTSPIIELPLEVAVINITNKIIPTQTIQPQVADPTAANITKPKETPKPKAKEPIAEIKIETPPLPQTKTDPTPPPASSSNLPPLEFTEQTIKDNMQRIVTESQIPIFAKKSFLTTVPKIEGNKIIFQSDSEFHKEKLTTPGVYVALKKALEKIVNQSPIEIEFIKTSIQRSHSPQNTNLASSNDFLTF